MRFLAAVLLCFQTAVGLAQPRTPEPEVDRGFNDLYNLRFSDARQVFDSWGKAHSEDPRTPAFQAAADLFDAFEQLHILQSEFVTNDDNFLFPKRRQIDPALRDRMLSEFAQSKQMSEARLAKDPNDENALFAMALRSGLYADYLALIDKSRLAALTQIKEGTAWADRLLRAHPDEYDAYIAGGVENYLLSEKDAPVRWFLRLGGAETDRTKGLNDLQIVAEKGRYLRPYAELLLAIAALRGGDKPQARKLLADLAERFPANPLYRKELEKIRG